jgi:hypothetical protein
MLCSCAYMHIQYVYVVLAVCDYYSNTVLHLYVCVCMHVCICLHLHNIICTYVHMTYVCAHNVYLHQVVYSIRMC